MGLPWWQTAICAGLLALSVAGLVALATSPWWGESDSNRNKRRRR